MIATLPLEKLRQQLSAPKSRKRMSALVEIEALGAAGRALAADVVARLEDEAAEVSWQAMHAFRAVGAGAADAVPLLLVFLARRESPLATRAGACLGVVGPVAFAAVPALRAAFAADPNDDAFLKALLEIAPREPAVVDAIFSAAFSDKYFVSSVATSALLEGDDPTIDRVFDEMTARMGGDEGSRQSVASLLSKLGARRPERAAGLLRGLLRDPAPVVRGVAVPAVGALPAPRPRDLVEALVEIASREAGSQEGAVMVLSELGADAEPAQRTLLDLLFRHADAPPLTGPEGARGRIFARAAVGIARSGATERAADPLPVLLQWLHAAAAAGRAAKKRAPVPSLHTVAEVLEAAASLAPRSPAIPEVILEVVAASRGYMREALRGRDDAPIHFDRSLRLIISTRDDSEALFSRAVALGLPRVDPWA